MHIIRGSNLKGYAGIKEVVYNNDNTYTEEILEILNF